MGISHSHYPEISLTKYSKYRKLIDGNFYQLHEYAHNMCRGCTYTDCIIDVCTIFSFFLRNQISVYKMDLSKCTCGSCIIKGNCTEICNDFTTFCLDFYTKLIGKPLDFEGLKRSLLYIKYSNKKNKERKKDKNNMYYFELTHLNIGSLEVGQQHEFRAFELDYDPEDRDLRVANSAKHFALYIMGNKI